LRANLVGCAALGATKKSNFVASALGARCDLFVASAAFSAAKNHFAWQVQHIKTLYFFVWPAQHFQQLKIISRGRRST